MLINGMPFVNDPEAIGKWEFVALTDSMENYNGEETDYDQEKAFREVYFMPEGKNYWIFEGWTKGIMLFWEGGNQTEIAERRYEIRTVNGERRMFMQSYHYPEIYIVLKKTSDIVVTDDSQIGRRENIDLPFVPDDRVLGEWLPVDFVSTPEEFDPQRKWDYLALKDINFLSDGTLIRHYEDIMSSQTWTDKWTKGAVLDLRKHTVNAYEIREVDGTEYLFVQWKTGNYIFGYHDPYYYVFKRKQ